MGVHRKKLISLLGASSVVLLSSVLGGYTTSKNTRNDEETSFRTISYDRKEILDAAYEILPMGWEPGEQGDYSLEENDLLRCTASVYAYGYVSVGEVKVDIQFEKDGSYRLTDPVFEMSEKGREELAKERKILDTTIQDLEKITKQYDQYDDTQKGNAQNDIYLLYDDADRNVSMYCIPGCTLHLLRTQNGVYPFARSANPAQTIKRFYREDYDKDGDEEYVLNIQENEKKGCLEVIDIIDGKAVSNIFEWGGVEEDIPAQCYLGNRTYTVDGRKITYSQDVYILEQSQNTEQPPSPSRVGFLTGEIEYRKDGSFQLLSNNFEVDQHDYMYLTPKQMLQSMSADELRSIKEFWKDDSNAQDEKDPQNAQDESIPKVKCVVTIPEKDIGLYTIASGGEKDFFVLRIKEDIYTVEDFTLDPAESYELLSGNFDWDGYEEYILVETIRDGDRQYDALKILDRPYDMEKLPDFGVSSVSVTSGNDHGKLYKKMVANPNTANKQVYMGDAKTYIADGALYYSVDVLEAGLKPAPIGSLIAKLRIWAYEDPEWDLEEPAFIVDLAGKKIKDKNKTIIASIPEEDTEIYSATTDDGISVTMLRVGEKEYQVSVKIDPKCPEVKFYSGDYDYDKKKEYALLQLYEQDAYEKDRVDIFEIEEYVRVAELNLTNSDYYNSPFISGEYKPGKGEIYPIDNGNFLISFEVKDAKNNRLKGYKFGELSYGRSLGRDAYGSYLNDFHIYISSIRDYPSTKEQSIIYDALNLEEEQCHSMPKITSDDTKKLTLFGVDSDLGEDMVLIKDKDSYPLDLDWKKYKDVTIQMEDYDKDGTEECAIIGKGAGETNLYILEFFGKECKIIQCPKKTQDDLPAMRKKIKEQGLRATDYLSFRIVEDQILYSFYVEENVERPRLSGSYEAKLIYHPDGTFEFVEDENEAQISLAMG